MTKRVKRVNSTNESSVVTNEKKANVVAEQNESVVTVQNFAADAIDKSNYDRAKRLLKKLNSSEFKFSAVRSHILALVANEKEVQSEQKNEVVLLLRKSKKDSELYHTLCDISEFSYKAITVKDANKAKVTTYCKAYTQTNVARACDMYIQVQKDLDVNYISSLKFECEKRAINKLKEQIANLQNEIATLAATIENLTDKELKKEYEDQQKIKQSTLKKKVVMFEYVSVSSNRSIIK